MDVHSNYHNHVAQDYHQQTKTSSISPALIISQTPVSICAIHTEKYGVFTIQAQPSSRHQHQQQHCLPNLDTLSLVPLTAFASHHNNNNNNNNTLNHNNNNYYDASIHSFETIIEKRGILLLSSSSSKKNHNGHFLKQRNLFEEDDNDSLLEGWSDDEKNILTIVSELKGLKHRLLDSATDVSSSPNKNEMELFLKQSDAIVLELISAIQQQQQKNKAKERRSISNNRKRQKRMTTSSDTMNNSNSTMMLSKRYLSVLFSQLQNVEKLLFQKQQQQQQLMSSSQRYNQEEERISSGEMDINEELNVVTIRYSDSKSREHKLIVDIPTSFPSTNPITSCELPIALEPQWKMTPYNNTNDDNAVEWAGGNSTNGIAGVVKQFIDLVIQYQPFWDEMEDLDTNTWVLEPSLPAQRSNTERRLALPKNKNNNNNSSSCSICLVLDPENPRSTPISMRLIGRDTQSLRSTYQKYVSSSATASSSTAKNNNDTEFWCESLSIRENLERCFGFSLPSPMTTNKSDFLIECGICYAHRLPTMNHNDNDETSTTITTSIIPNITCDNPSCGRSYHETCIMEWLQSLPSAKVSLDRLFGTCPYCSEPISVPTTITS